MSNYHHVLVDAKTEYTKQLINMISPRIYEGIESVYKESIKISKYNNYLKTFQELLSDIPTWNNSIIEGEYERIMKISSCDWIEELITAVFVSHTKVLTAIKVKGKKDKTIELKIPNGKNFIHKCYIDIARKFWKRPDLFFHKYSNLELQRNMFESERIIEITIEETIRKLLPVKNILKEYLGNDYCDDSDIDDISMSISNNAKENLRKMVKKEIENSLNKNENDSSDKYSNYTLNNNNTSNQNGSGINNINNDKKENVELETLLNIEDKKENVELESIKIEDKKENVEVKHINIEDKENVENNKVNIELKHINIEDTKENVENNNNVDTKDKTGNMEDTKLNVELKHINININDTKEIVKDTKEIVEDTKEIVEDTKEIVEDAKEIVEDAKEIVEVKHINIEDTNENVKDKKVNIKLESINKEDTNENVKDKKVNIKLESINKEDTNENVKDKKVNIELESIDIDIDENATEILLNELQNYKIKSENTLVDESYFFNDAISYS